MIQKLIKFIKTFVQPIKINSKLYSKVYIFQNSVLSVIVQCLRYLTYYTKKTYKCFYNKNS